MTRSIHPSYGKTGDKTVTTRKTPAKAPVTDIRDHPAYHALIQGLGEESARLTTEALQKRDQMWEDALRARGLVPGNAARGELVTVIRDNTGKVTHALKETVTLG